MDKRILVDAAYPNNTQVAVIKDNRLEEIEYTSTTKKLIKGNLYLAKITRIEPSLQAAFINYGEEKNGFISFSEIHRDYYNVPVKYRQQDIDEHTESEESITEQVSQEKDVKNENEPLEDNVEENENSLKDVDSVSSDDENYIEKIKQENAERYKIQEVLKKDQILLVQAVKEARGTKGAMFTTYVSLAGKYCVVMPNSVSSGGISRRIADIEARKKLQKIFDQINEKAQLSFIIRTAGQGRGKRDIQTDYNYLVKLWNNIREKTLSADAPAFIHAEDDILKKTVRDLYDKDTKEIIVQGEEGYKSILSTVKLMTLTKHVKVQKYGEKTPIFDKFKISEQISSLYDSVVHLKSGSYIVINRTEALTAIDVNSGKSTSERNVEKTAVKTNIEAAEEIVRQIRLRNISGLIVIDFIDMMDSRNKILVERTMRNLLRNDKAKLQIGRISNFGLLEMSRQYLRPSFTELNAIPCDQCKGNGVIKSNEITAVKIFKTIEQEILDNKNTSVLNVHLSSKMALFMLNHKRKEIKALEDKYQISLFILQDHDVSIDCFAIDIVNKKENLKNDSNSLGDAESKPTQTTSTSDKENKKKSNVVLPTPTKIPENTSRKSRKKESQLSKKTTKKTTTKNKLKKTKEEDNKNNAKNSGGKTDSNTKNDKKKPKKSSRVKKILDKLLG
ncbi:MAG: Rne/Rng family ribonuclease [Rickettsiales bacterium]|nr:Rne/Rng family ribonuclease [Rickettsiales bacterium]